MKKFAFTLVAGFGLFAGGSVALADEQTHVVEPGDTLSSLAATYETTVDEIMTLNASIVDPNLIFDGETLLIFSDSQVVEQKEISSGSVVTSNSESEAIVESEPAASANSSQAQASTPNSGSGVLNPVDGINYYGGVRESYYSQNVLPGGGLNIPGRYVASDGTIRDADGYIVVASDNQAKGSTGQSSLGAYKVYDTGVGHSGIDVYTNW